MSYLNYFCWLAIWLDAFFALAMTARDLYVYLRKPPPTLGKGVPTKSWGNCRLHLGSLQGTEGLSEYYRAHRPLTTPIEFWVVKPQCHSQRPDNS